MEFLIDLFTYGMNRIWNISIFKQLNKNNDKLHRPVADSSPCLSLDVLQDITKLMLFVCDFQLDFLCIH